MSVQILWNWCLMCHAEVGWEICISEELCKTCVFHNATFCIVSVLILVVMDNHLNTYVFIFVEFNNSDYFPIQIYNASR